MTYVELHAHSAFSFLDGASLPEELAVAAARRGHRALALTDHNSVSGAMEHAQAARDAGLRAIHGAEVDVELRPGDARAGRTRHVTLLVRDPRGWRGLCRLLTAAHAHDRDPDRPAGSPGRPAPPPAVGLDTLAEHAEGLVCLTGCATHGIDDEPTARRLRDAFGRAGLRVELQRPFARDDRARNRARAALARRLEVACVATGDVHAHTRERAQLQDALVALRHHLTLDASEPFRRPNHAHVLTTPRAMAARFADHPDAVAETERLADELRFDLTEDLGYRYPGAEDPTADRRLAETCRARFDVRYPPGSPRHGEALGRLEEELRIIAALGLSGFFLLHHELLELARAVAAEVRGADTARALLPPGRGRGSSVSSLVCYLTGLSHVDPLVSGLRLGRFLHEDLGTLPDIDLDFPRDVREVLIPRVHDRFGRDRSALVAAFPTFRSRGAIRELGKALGLPPGEIERVARGSEGNADEVGRDIAAALGEGRVDTTPPTRWGWLARLAAEARGLPRHLSQHSGGMVVATRPLVDCCPVVPAAMEGRQLVQWDKDSCADAGFCKIDLLGLGMLSAVERCVELIARERGQRIDLSRVPLDDAETYAMIGRADTTGVFQIESRAQMASLRRTRPETIEDLTVQVAIVRPGPIVGGAVSPYIERRQRRRADPGWPIPYEHPSLVEPLRDTLGAIIFQDQVIEVARAFAGFTAGEAEAVRRAMSRKRSQAAMDEQRQRFVEGAMRTHADVDRDTAERVWSMVVGFSGFGFPRAHAAAFALLAYQSTWLRVHYAPEFLCALLNEQPMGFYAPDALVHEAQRRGVRVLAVDVNASEAECTPEDGAVRIGLGYVKGVGREQAEALAAVRRQDGPFASIADLAARAGVGHGVLEQLAWAGACDRLFGAAQHAAARAVARLRALPPRRDPPHPPHPPLGGPPRRRERANPECPADTPPGPAPEAARRVALWQAGVAAPAQPVAGGVQLALALEGSASPPLRPLTRWERVLADYATTEVTIDDHVVAILRPELDGVVSTADLHALPDGAPVALPGLVIARQRPGTANGIVFLLLEDEHGTVNVVVFPPVYERHRHLVRAEPLLLVAGTLERHASAGGAVNLIATDLRALGALGEDGRPAAVVDLARARAAPPMGTAIDPSREGAATAGGAAGGRDFAPVAPAVQSFASGRRR